MMLLFVSVKESAQDILGIVVSDKYKPIAFANIALKDSMDSALLVGCVSREDGTFALPMKGDDGKVYLLSVSLVGYKTQSRLCRSGDKLEIVLNEDTLALGEVVVKSRLPKTVLKGDALVTNVANSTLSKMGTAKAVLTKIPGVVVQNDNIEVFGKGEPVIYVNGKVMRDKGELSLINADDIKEVEVIENPGASYAATTNAVIRIITNSKEEELAVNMRTDNTFSYYYSNNSQVDIEYKGNKTEVFGLLNFDKKKNRSRINFLQKTFADKTWSLDNAAKVRATQRFFTGKVGMVYLPNDSNSLGFYCQNGYSKEMEDESNICSVLEDESFYDRWSSSGDATARLDPKAELNAYYNGKLGRLLVDFNVDYLYSKSSKNRLWMELSHNYNDRTVSTSYANRNKLFAEKLVVSYPVWRGVLSVGEEYSFTQRNNRFSNLEGILPGSNNDIKEESRSAFAEQSLVLGRFSLSYGVRYERVVSQYRSTSSVDWQKRKYNNVYPSLSLAFPIAKSRLSLNFNTKTTRPSYSQLDGNLSYINRFHLLSGNPSLQPVKKTNISAAFSGGWLYVQVSYTHSKSEIVYTSESLANNPKVSLVTYRNHDKLDRLNAYCSLSPHFGLWNPTVNIGILQQWFNMTYLSDKPKSFNRPIVFAQLNNVFEFTDRFFVRLDGSFQGEGNNQNMQLNNLFRMDCSIGKSFFKQRLDIRIDCNDIFDTYRFKPMLYNTNMIINQENIVDTRNIVLSLTYKLNSLKKRYKGAGAGNGEKERL